MTDVLETNDSSLEENLAGNEVANKPESIQETPKNELKTREDVINALSLAVNLPVEVAKDEVDNLKQTYYKIRKQEVDAAQAAFRADEANKGSEFKVEPDLLEGKLKELTAVFKVKRQAALEERERAKEANFAQKEQCLNQMKAIIEDPDNVSKRYNEFMDLKKAFIEIKDIPAAKINDIYNSFQSCIEIFYDLLKINNELRDYDFKKNLERKEAICLEAEQLVAAEDILTSCRRLRELHDEWKTLGPVAPALRDEIWTRFKNSSTSINKRHQQYFDELKAEETKNEEAKNALSEKLASIDYSKLEVLKDWEDATAAVIALQEEWKKIGFAAKKINYQLSDKFYKSCDEFFKAKTRFFQERKEERNSNLEKKIALCEKAETLKDSKEWRSATDKILALKKEWRTIGAVPKKSAEALWDRFNSACDAFFSEKDKAFSSERTAEKANLVLKQAVVAELKALVEAGVKERKALKDMSDKWNAIGRIPYKDKDTLYDEFHSLLDSAYKTIESKGRKAHLDNYADNIKKMSDSSSFGRERDRLVKTYERIKSEVTNYENNMGFLTFSSKKGSSLLKDMQRKVELLKADMQTVLTKIEMLDKKD